MSRFLVRREFTCGILMDKRTLDHTYHEGDLIEVSNFTMTEGVYEFMLPNGNFIDYIPESYVSKE